MPAIFHERSAKSRALSAHQRNEAFLGKVTVVGQRFPKPVRSHRFHRNAIDQTVPLIGSQLVERQSLEEGAVRLRKDDKFLPSENSLHNGDCEPADSRAFGGKGRQEFGQTSSVVQTQE